MSNYKAQKPQKTAEIAKQLRWHKGLYFCLVFNPAMDKTFNAINEWGIHFVISGFCPHECFVSVPIVVGWSRGKKLLLWAEILKQVLVFTCQVVTLHVYALCNSVLPATHFYLPDLSCWEEVLCISCNPVPFTYMAAYVCVCALS